MGTRSQLRPPGPALASASRQRRRLPAPSLPPAEPLSWDDLGAELEQEVEQLERRLAASESEQARLTRELEDALERCAELEELAAGQLNQSLDQSASNEKLQRRLEAIAAENEDLHRQAFEAAQAQHRAKAETVSLLSVVAELNDRHRLGGDDARAQVAELSQEVEQLRAERDQLLASVAQLQMSNPASELAASASASLSPALLPGALPPLPEALPGLPPGGFLPGTPGAALAATPRAAATSPELRCVELDALHRGEVQRRQAAEEAAAEEARLRHAAEETCRMETERREALESTHSLVPHKDRQILALQEMLEEYAGIVEELQSNYVNQTLEYKNVVNQTRAANIQCAQILHSEESGLEEVLALRQSLEHVQLNQRMWRGTCEQLEAHVDDLHRDHSRFSEAYRDQQERLLSKQEGKAARREHLHKANLCQQISRAFRGCKLQKVTLAGKKEERFLQISDVEGYSALTLRWAKAPFKTFVAKSSLDLNRVVLIGYGYSARAWAMFDDAPVELCVTIYTIRRAFDFVCSTEADAEAFVLAVSRMCACLQGYHVPGSIESHAKFAAAKGWSKLEAGCRRLKVPLTKRFMGAIARAHLKRPQWDKTPGTASTGATPRLPLETLEPTPRSTPSRASARRPSATSLPVPDIDYDRLPVQPPPLATLPLPPAAPAEAPPAQAPRRRQSERPSERPPARPSERTSSALPLQPRRSLRLPSPPGQDAGIAGPTGYE